MRYNYQTIHVCLFILATSYLAGCAAINSFPVAARPGDTVSLALGSQDGMTKTNTTVSFTEIATNIVYDLTADVRAIIRLYADPTSGVYGGGTGYLGTFLTQDIHHDPWLSTMVLDLPTTLPIGPGIITIDTTAPQPGPGEAVPDINTHTIAIEILPGTGTPNTFDFTAFGTTVGGTLVPLEPRPQFVIRPPNAPFYSAGSYGAIEMSFQLPVTIPDPDVDVISVVPQNLQLVTQSKRQVLWKARGNNLKVMFISTEGRLDVLETRFSLLSENTSVFPETTPPTLLSVNYYDIDGNMIAGPAVGGFTISSE